MPRMARVVSALGATIAVALVGASTAAAFPANLVVAQVYGGGAVNNAVYNHDYIELFNRGNSSVSLTGKSVQYAATDSMAWAVTSLPSVSLAPGQYFLVQEGTDGSGGAALPTPDATGTINLDESAGKVVVYVNTTAIPNFCSDFDANAIDLLGYGSEVFHCAEGAGSAPPPSGTKADFRKAGGCQDTDVNADDFVAKAPSPLNTSTTVACTTTTVSASTTSSKVKANGHVAPSATGDPVKVSLLQDTGKGFKTVDHKSPILDGSSNYATSLARPNKGKCKVKSSFAGDSTHAPSSASSSKFHC